MSPNVSSHMVHPGTGNKAVALLASAGLEDLQLLAPVLRHPDSSVFGIPKACRVSNGALSSISESWLRPMRQFRFRLHAFSPRTACRLPCPEGLCPAEFQQEGFLRTCLSLPRRWQLAAIGQLLAPARLSRSRAFTAQRFNRQDFVGYRLQEVFIFPAVKSSRFARVSKAARRPESVGKTRFQSFRVSAGDGGLVGSMPQRPDQRKLRLCQRSLMIAASGQSSASEGGTGHHGVSLEIHGPM